MEIRGPLELPAHREDIDLETADGLTLVGCDVTTGLGGTQLLTRVPGLPTSIAAGLVQEAVDAGAEVFELLQPLTLYTAHNALRFHTWSDDECCLPQGAVQAFLRDDDANRLRLRPGDVLVLESLASATTGGPNVWTRRFADVPPCGVSVVQGSVRSGFERRDPTAARPPRQARRLML